MDEALFQNFALAMIAIVNPIGKVPVWVKAAEGCDGAVRLRLAALVSITAAALLLIFLFFGRFVLEFLGLDLAAVQVGGGIVILMTGLEMLKGSEIQLDDDESHSDKDAYGRAKSRFREIVVPFAMPILAGPGSIITVILFGFRAEDWTQRSIMAAMLVAIMLLVFLVLLVGQRVQATVGDLALNVQSRIWGLLLTAIAAQMVMVGLGDAYPAWVQSDSPIADDLRSQDTRARD